MRISEVTIDDLKVYCRAEDGEESLFQAILAAGKDFIKGQTGLTEEEMDKYEDLTIALYILSAEWYENRAYNLVHAKVTANPAVTAILGQHCRTLL